MTPSMPGAASISAFIACACVSVSPGTMTRAFGTDAENSSCIICSATVDSASAGRYAVIS